MVHFLLVHFLLHVVLQDREPLVPAMGKLVLPPLASSTTDAVKEDFNDLLLKQSEARAQKREACHASEFCM